MTPAVALSIAGSDSGGGAGVQADLLTFAALGVHGTCALTAVTAQNTRGVTGVHVVPEGTVVDQVEAVLGDLPVTAVKTGMLASAGIVRVVAALAGAGRLPRLVVDPVMVASSGDRLLEGSAERLYVDELLPHATLVTPNLREAEILLGTTIGSRSEQREAARALAEGGAAAVVVKGGHATDDDEDRDAAVDVVWDGRGMHELRAPRIDTANHHGTGCTFAAAATAALAQGDDVVEALRRAKAFVSAALAGGAGRRLGGGHGPLDHGAPGRPPTGVTPR